jgi:hypothetical protein
MGRWTLDGANIQDGIPRRGDGWGGHVKGPEIIEAPGDVRGDRLPVKASLPVPGKGLDGRIGGHGATPIAPEQAPPESRTRP